MSPAVDAVVYTVAALAAIGCAALVVSRRNPVYSAVFMVVFFVLQSLGFFLLQAPFLAVIQLLVYGGAIMVLYLFVIMLLNLKPEELRDEVTLRRRILAGLGAGGLFLLLAWAIRGSERVQRLSGELTLSSPPAAGAKIAAESGSIGAIADELFAEHGLAFELTSVLILIAVIGAIYLTKKGRALSGDGTQPG